MAEDKDGNANKSIAHTLSVKDPQSVAVAQALYNTITGKSEKLGRFFDKNYQFSFEDYKQLHLKLNQNCNQWAVHNISSSVTIYHLNDAKQTFSSFDRFELYDASITSPIECIVYELNILLSIPHSDKPQHYKVTVRTVSKITLFKRMMSDSPPPSFIKYFNHPPIFIEIEYVDYVIARNISSMLESWVDELETKPNGKIIAFIQRHSEIIPPVFQAVTIGAVALGFFTLIQSPEFIDLSINQATGWIILSLSVIAILTLLSKHIGRSVENGIDTVMDISAILINKGDTKLHSDQKSDNVIAITRSVLLTLAIAAEAYFIDSILEKTVSWALGN